MHDFGFAGNEICAYKISPCVHAAGMAAVLFGVMLFVMCGKLH